MKVSRIAAPITVLGPGRRAAVWVQGCTLACSGCASVDTWASEGGREMSVAEVAAEVLRLVALEHLDGVTVSGGEPFQQADAVADVLDVVLSARADLDVVVFTGYDAQVARRRGPRLAALADVLVAGRYDPTQPSSQPLLASANQQLVLLPRGEAAVAGLSRQRLQVAAADGDLFVVGLPAPGDFDRLAADLAARGVELAGASWS